MKLQSLVFVSERLEELGMAADLQLSGYNELPSFPGQPTRTTDLAYTDTQAPPDKGPSDAPPPGGVQGLQ